LCWFAAAAAIGKVPDLSVGLSSAITHTGDRGGREAVEQTHINIDIIIRKGEEERGAQVRDLDRATTELTRTLATTLRRLTHANKTCA